MGSMDTAFGTALMGTSLSLVLPMLTMIVSAVCIPQHHTQTAPSDARVYGLNFLLCVLDLALIAVQSVLFNFYDKLLEKCNVGRFQFSEHFSDENVEMGAHMLSNGFKIVYYNHCLFTVERNKRKVEETTLRSVHVIEKYQSCEYMLP